MPSQWNLLARLKNRLTVLQYHYGEEPFREDHARAMRELVHRIETMEAEMIQLF